MEECAELGIGILATLDVDAMCEHIISLGTKLKAYEQPVDIETYCLHRRLWDKLTESRIVSVAFHSTPRFRFKLLPLLGSDVDCPAVAFVASPVGSGL